MLFAQKFAGRGETVLSGHLEIEEDELRRMLPCFLKGGGSVGGSPHIEAEPAQKKPGHHEIGPVVIDDKDLEAFQAGRTGGAACGGLLPPEQIVGRSDKGAGKELQAKRFHKVEDMTEAATAPIPWIAGIGQNKPDRGAAVRLLTEVKEALRRFKERRRLIDQDAVALPHASAGFLQIVGHEDFHSEGTELSGEDFPRARPA